MSSLFSKIVTGEIPCYKIAEDEKHLAFLDILPLKEGHVLVIPKIEVDYYFDLSPIDLADLNLFAQKVAIGLKKAVPCKKIGVAVVGLEVPHVHIHLVPMDSIGELNFSNPRAKFSQEEFEHTANKIKEQL